MLRFLRIRNLATIEDLQIEFEDGFSILTGETGAGKSIIIDSIRLACGEKADAEMVRTGRPEASVEAVFSAAATAAGPDGLFEAGDPEEVMIQRTVADDGSGKAYCGGVLVPVRRLKDLTAALVDIYGQNDHVFLLRLDSHRDYVDQFARTLTLREDVARTAQNIRRMLRQRDEWRNRERERGQRLDFLSYQIREIEKADLKPDEEQDLRAQRHVLKNAAKISELVDQALDISYAGEASITGALAKREHALAELGTFDPAFAEMGAALSPLGIVVKEVANGLSQYRNRVDLAPEKLEAIEERLSLIESLKRKYGADLRDIRFYLETIRREREDLVRVQGKLADVATALAAAFAAYVQKANALTEARTKAARALETQIEDEIGLLGMKKARFAIKVESAPATSPEAERIKDTGFDDIEFLISPNPGEQLRPLRKVASGGELSRIMLALKAVGKDRAEGKTLIFDEIDAGIGGKTAEFIARKLRALAASHQILCITHLPQIASFARHHYRIEKTVARDRTFTAVKKLEFEERVEEVARLMAGSRVSEASLASARDMLHHNQGGRGA
jgi:DNA repair protein RecN (Recombination protein N)